MKTKFNKTVTPYYGQRTQTENRLVAILRSKGFGLSHVDIGLYTIKTTIQHEQAAILLVRDWNYKFI